MIKRILFIFFVGLLTFIVPSTTLAANYGDGAYGDCTYGTDCTSSGGSSSSGSSGGGGNSGGSAGSTSVCNATAPSSAPNLYEIDVNNNSATLFFSPAGSPYDSYYISYGTGSNSEGYGVQFSQGQTRGALNYTINQLSPNTTYTFKVRAGNSCQTGPWSSNLTITTTGSKKIVKFFPNNQTPSVTSKPVGWFAQAQAFANNLLPKTPSVGKAQDKQIMGSKAQAPKAKEAPQQAPSPSLWSTVVTFFKGLF